jgi:hypothetical protein
MNRMKPTEGTRRISAVIEAAPGGSAGSAAARLALLAAA